MEFLIGLIIGLFVGCFIGVFTMTLIVANTRTDTEYNEMTKYCMGVKNGEKIKDKMERNS